jgi:hypothetical protein
MINEIIMKKLVKSATLACALLLTFGTYANESLHTHQKTNKFDDCNSNNLIDIQTLEKTVGITKPILGVLNSGRYCINSYRIGSVAATDFIAKDEVSAMRRRYHKAINKFENDFDKLVFIDSFLQKLTREKYVTSSPQIFKELLAVGFVTSRNVGETFHLLPNAKFDDKLFSLYADVIKEEVQPSRSTLLLVNYVLYDNEYSSDSTVHNPDK